MEDRTIRSEPPVRGDLQVEAPPQDPTGLEQMPRKSGRGEHQGWASLGSLTSAAGLLEGQEPAVKTARWERAGLAVLGPQDSAKQAMSTGQDPEAEALRKEGTDRRGHLPLLLRAGLATQNCILQ